MGTMKVLLVAPQPYYEERGTPIAVRQLATTLAKQGHEVILLSYPFGENPHDPGVTVIRCARLPLIKDMPIGFSGKKLVYDVPLSLSIFTALVRYRVDVIHAVEEAVYPALLASVFSRAKVVYDMDSSLADQLVTAKPSLSFLRRLLSWLEHRAIRRADAVVAVCDELAEQARAATSPERIYTLYDVPNEPAEPVDADAVDDLRRYATDGQQIGVYVGNLEPYQGIDLLMSAIEKLPDDLPLLSIVIGGKAEHIEHYEAEAKRLGIAERLLFVGPRPLAHLAALLRQADLLYSPRVTGGNTPMKLYSYMASGRPVVATRLSTHTQVLNDASAMLPEPEAESYAAAIVALVQAPDRAKRIGAAALALVEQKYSRKRFEESVEALYQRLSGLD